MIPELVFTISGIPTDRTNPVGTDQGTCQDQSETLLQHDLLPNDANRLVLNRASRSRSFA